MLNINVIQRVSHALSLHTALCFLPTAQGQQTESFLSVSHSQDGVKKEKAQRNDH